ncbi:MAG: 3-phenylpropionate/cinnamic acid dioxygenase subunit beta [Micromonospora sp.]
MTLQINLADREVQESVRDFLHLESLALDERRFRDWLTAFAEDARYEVPVRVTREKLAEWELSPTSRIFDDTKRTLEFRVERLETDFAWSEQPPSRTRHYVTNVLVERTDTADEYLVHSNCLIYRSRGDDPNPSIFSTQRKDRIRKADDSWQIVHRWAAIDQSLINAHNMSIFI